jgi:hypothetical protein
METNHRCNYETDIALLKDHSNVMDVAIQNLDNKLNKILEVLRGNGKRGLVTEVEVLKGSLQRLWWFVSVICVATVGLIIKKYLG